MHTNNKIIIIRANNGWILERKEQIGSHGDRCASQEVFEDGCGGLDNHLGRADSLSSLLWEAFQAEYQSGRSGGLSVEVEEHGYDEEEPKTLQDPENRPNLSPDPLNVEKML